MTTKFEEKLYSAGQKIALTFDEREALRARLLKRIEDSSKTNLSPFSPFFYWQRVSIYIKPQYVSMALLAILVGGGVSIAAESALPGEPLYQVKTSVNENVLALLAFSPQSKAQLQTELVGRRLDEVEQLAIAGKLDATTTAAAESKINANLVAIKDTVKQLEKDNNTVAAADTSSKAESSLKVHEAILGTLSDNNPSITASIKDVAINVGIQATALSLDREGVDSKNASTTPSIDVLLEQQKTAQSAIALLQSNLATTTVALDVVDSPVATFSAKVLVGTSTDLEATSTATTTQDAFQSKLQSASDFLAQGSKKLDAKEFGEAFLLFKKAEKAALEGQLLLAGTATSTATSTADLIIK